MNSQIQGHFAGCLSNLKQSEGHISLSLIIAMAIIHLTFVLKGENHRWRPEKERPIESPKAIQVSKAHWLTPGVKSACR